VVGSKRQFYKIKLLSYFVKQNSRRQWVAKYSILEIFLQTFLLSRKRKVDVHGQVRGTF
jgi:hypothetical protein